MSAAAGVTAVSMRVRVTRAAAALTFGAALVHGSVMATHFREWFLFGLFFAIVTPLQLAWSAAVVRRAGPLRTVLVAGAVASVGIVVLWLVTRTVGLPFGPDIGQAEKIGVKDVLASLDELGTAALVWIALRPGEPGRRVTAAAEVGAWGLVSISLVGALLGGGH